LNSPPPCIAAEFRIHRRSPKHPALYRPAGRKGTPFFFNGLDHNGFYKEINPVILEPVLQFTLCLKVEYELARSLLLFVIP